MAQRKRPLILRSTAQIHSIRNLALTGFEPALRLVDNIDAALAAHDAAVAVTLLERAERIFDLHGLLLSSRRGLAPLQLPQWGEKIYHGGRYKVRTCDPYDVNVVLYH
jgi:hypothetical protein